MSRKRRQIARRIKARREALGIPATVVARKVGASRWTYAGWETGDRSIPSESLIPLAGALDMTVAALLGVVVAATVASPETAEVAA